VFAAMPSDGSTVDDFGPTASLETLKLRADLLRRLRSFFDCRGFLEVETPLLSADTVVDRHLDPLPVTLFDDPRQVDSGRTMWLQTSPEFAMKRLLASGATAIYQVTRAFRGGECGEWHNPEFTIAEWYRVGDGLDEGMRLLSELADEMLRLGPAERLTYREAFLTHVGVDPHIASCEDLQDSARKHGLSVPAGLSTQDHEGWVDLLLVECVEARLGHDRPTIIYDYPVSGAAIAQVRDDDPPVAERFELYVRGIELANGYHELLDPEVLHRRNRIANERRAADGKYTLPEDSRLLSAMVAGLPPCTGVALGFDRLVALESGVAGVSKAMAFSVKRA
jgi:lysyl-tRNA synthetase class 2